MNIVQLTETNRAPRSMEPFFLASLLRFFFNGRSSGRTHSASVGLCVCMGTNAVNNNPGGKPEIHPPSPDNNYWETTMLVIEDKDIQHGPQPSKRAHGLVMEKDKWLHTRWSTVVEVNWGATQEAKIQREERVWTVQVDFTEKTQMNEIETPQAEKESSHLRLRRSKSMKLWKSTRPGDYK